MKKFYGSVFPLFLLVGISILIFSGCVGEEKEELLANNYSKALDETINNKDPFPTDDGSLVVGSPNVPGNTNTLPVANNCVNIDNDNLVVFNETLTDQMDFTLVFKNKEEAKAALNVLKAYNFDEYCTLQGSDVFAYFLSEGDIPSLSDLTDGTIESENCITQKLEELEVRLTSGGKYIVVNPITDNWQFSSENEAGAQDILEVMKIYRAVSICYIGQPEGKMIYLKKEM